MADRAGLIWLALLGYVFVRDDHVPTGLDKTRIHWPVRVLGPEGTPLLGRGGSAITQEYRPPEHMGVDIAVPGQYRAAKARVLAVAAGKVVRASKGPRGWAVLLSHGDWASGYLHLASVEVADGASVLAGADLGEMGADPMDPEGIVHLHLQLAPGGRTVDPAAYLRRAV